LKAYHWSSWHGLKSLWRVLIHIKKSLDYTSLNFENWLPRSKIMTLWIVLPFRTFLQLVPEHPTQTICRMG
jgi:hypothetical protein